MSRSADTTVLGLPTGLLVLELYDGAGWATLLGLMVLGEPAAMPRVHALRTVMRAPPPDCTACGAPFDRPPAAFGLLLPQDPAPGATALAFACCTTCTADGPEAVRAKLGAFVIRATGAHPVCDAPGAMQ